jgi:hypothetical protein
MSACYDGTEASFDSFRSYVHNVAWFALDEIFRLPSTQKSLYGLIRITNASAVNQALLYENEKKFPYHRKKDWNRLFKKVREYASYQSIPNLETLFEQFPQQPQALLENEDFLLASTHSLQQMIFLVIYSGDSIARVFQIEDNDTEAVAFTQSICRSIKIRQPKRRNKMHEFLWGLTFSTLDTKREFSKWTSEHCSYCGKHCQKLKICRGCLYSCYCSNACWETDWPFHRGGVCKFLSVIPFLLAL